MLSIKMYKITYAFAVHRKQTIERKIIGNQLREVDTTYISRDLSVWLMSYTLTDTRQPVDIDSSLLSMLLPRIDANT